MTTRGKTTPASTGGSYAPHTGGRSRATLEDSAAFDELADTMQSWAGDYLTDDDIDGRLNDAAHAAVAALNGEPIEANADRTSGLYALNDNMSMWAAANGYDPAAEGFDERLDNAVHAAAAILDPPPAPAPLSHWSEDCKEGPFAEVAGLNWKDRYGGRNLADTEAAVRIAAALSRMRAEMQTTQEVQTPAYRRIDETGVPAAVRFSSPQGRAEGQIVQVEYGTFGRGEGCKGDPFMRRRDTSTGCAWSYYRLDAIDDYDAWMHAGRPTTVA